LIKARQVFSNICHMCIHHIFIWPGILIEISCELLCSCKRNINKLSSSKQLVYFYCYSLCEIFG
jgi:hypothetical protein